MDAVKYPGIRVQLTGNDGNAFALIGKVRRALLRGGVGGRQISEFMAEATNGNYDNLLQTCMRWVEVA